MSLLRTSRASQAHSALIKRSRFLSCSHLSRPTTTPHSDSCTTTRSTSPRQRQLHLSSPRQTAAAPSDPPTSSSPSPRVRSSEQVDKILAGLQGVSEAQIKSDEWTNVTPTILSKVGRNLHLLPAHPIGILAAKIQSHFTTFTHLSTLSPLVTVQANFDDLGFPPSHPGRSKTDSYYLNSSHMLRTHTSAHEVESFRAGLEQFLLTADVYRRDEIDRSHYPVFHQMEGCNIVSREDGGIERLRAENALMAASLDRANIIIEDPTRGISPTNPIQVEHTEEEAMVLAEHLKHSLNGLVWSLFGGLGSGEEPLRVRWIEATFPWTSPSYEVEVMFQGKWLEILGCGVVRQDTLNRSGVPHKLGWAFGLGLERIAMVLFSIPDIRLFWSTDPRFLSQFKKDEITTFRSYSKYPECYKDLSLWVPTEGWHENDFCEVVRDCAGDLVEGVELIDEFVHPTSGRRSVCYRLNYRSMDRSLSNEEVNEIQAQVVEKVVEQMGVEVR